MGTSKLFSPAQVVVATLLGSPLAGGIVLALSHRRARSGRAWIPLVVGAALTAALVVVGILVDSAPSSLVGVVGVVAMWQLANAQHPALVAAVGAPAPAPSASWLAPIAIGIGTLVAGVAIAVAAIYVTEIAAPSVSWGDHQDVQYTGDATIADARIVGSFLMSNGIFRTDGADKTVRVSRSRSGVVVSFVVGDDAWDKQDVIAAFTLIRQQLAELFPETKLTVHLCDGMMDNHRAIE